MTAELVMELVRVLTVSQTGIYFGLKENIRNQMGMHFWHNKNVWFFLTPKGKEDTKDSKRS